MSVSVICSDKVLDFGSLTLVASDIRSDFDSEDPHEWNFDPGAHTFIARRFDNPSWRDLLTIRSTAKQGWLQKQMNWHHCGPDGYYVEVVTRGADVEKSKFDMIFREHGENVFLADAYFDGQIRSNAIPKPAWYCMFDLMQFARRTLKASTYTEEILLIHAETYTTSYLNEKFGIAI